ncbi:MAG TPA: DUF1569 domain-containing protein [Isosphaeraceae bacterium]
MPERRSLEFARLDDVMPDVDRLLAGHAMVGNLSLGQVCNHLAGSIRKSVDGYGVQAPWLVRMTIGRVVKRKILGERRIQPGIKTAESLVPKPGLDDRAEAEALRASIAYYLAHGGPKAPHPFFGPMTGDQWYQLHCIHFAHHLSFALPA